MYLNNDLGQRIEIIHVITYINVSHRINVHVKLLILGQQRFSSSMDGVILLICGKQFYDCIIS